MEGFLVISGLLTFIIGLYLLSYLMNNNTPVPEGIEPADKCSSCNAPSCSVRDTPSKDDCEVEPQHIKIEVD
jgi:hypothetical protein